VGVAHALVDRAPAQPLHGERPRPGAGDRMVGGDVDRHAPVAQTMGADVRQPGVGRSEGRVARGAAALGQDDGGVGKQRERDDHRDDGRGAQAQWGGARVAAGLQKRRPGGDGREQREDGQTLRRAVAGVQGTHGAEGRGRGARERPGAERDRRRAQLRAGAVEGDERGQAGEQARDRAAREAQVGAHAQRGRGCRGRDAQRARARDVAGEASAEDEPDRRQRAGRVPVGHGLLQAPARPRGGVQVHDAGQQPPAQPVADDDEGTGRQRRLDHARRAPIAPRHRAGGERRQVEQRELELLVGPGGARGPARRDPRPRRQPGEREEGGARGPRARKRQPGDGERGQREQRPGADGGDEARSLEEGAAEERQHHREQQEAGLDGRERCAAHGGAAYPR
jgi:hypothetical protein